MQKPDVDSRTPPDQRRPSVQLPNHIEGQLAELCRDLAVEAKRIRHLQEQADQLRMVIHQWVNDSERPNSGREPAGRPGRR